MGIENTDTLELKDRYESLIRRYLEIVGPLTNLLEDFGRVRGELEIIVEELKKRNVSYSEIDQKYEKTADQ